VTREPKWLSKAAVLAIHERLLAEHGGAGGILDEGSLEAALAAPRNRFLYDQADVFRLAAAYAQALTRNHPFRDGNKRVALTAAAVFLERNGYLLGSSESDAAAAMVALVERKMDEVRLADWLRVSCARVLRKRPAKTAARKKRRD
jgi:death-on-curing protein